MFGTRRLRRNCCAGYLRGMKPSDHVDDININPIIGRMAGQIPVTKREFFNVRHEIVDNRMPALC